jgi:hypothetical protein
MELELLDEIAKSSGNHSTERSSSVNARSRTMMHPTSRVVQQEQVRSTSVSPRPRPKSSEHIRPPPNGTPAIPPRPPKAGPRKNIPAKVDASNRTVVVTPPEESSSSEMNLMAFSPTNVPSKHSFDDFDPLPRRPVSPCPSSGASADLYAVMHLSSSSDSESVYASITGVQSSALGTVGQFQRTTNASQPVQAPGLSSVQNAPDFQSGASHGISIHPVSGVASFNKDEPPTAIPPRPNGDQNIPIPTRPQGNFPAPIQSRTAIPPRPNSDQNIPIPTRSQGNFPAPIQSRNLPVNVMHSGGARPKIGSLSADMESSSRKRSGMVGSTSTEFIDQANRRQHMSDIPVPSRSSESDLMFFGYSQSHGKPSNSYFDPLLNQVSLDDLSSLEFQGYRRTEGPNPFPELGLKAKNYDVTRLSPVPGSLPSSRENSSYDPSYQSLHHSGEYQLNTNYQCLLPSGEYATYQDIDGALQDAEEFNPVENEIQDPFLISSLILFAQHHAATPPLPPRPRLAKESAKESEKVPVKDETEPEVAPPLPPRPKMQIQKSIIGWVSDSLYTGIP